MNRRIRKCFRDFFIFICPRLFVSALRAYKKSGKNIKLFFDLFVGNYAHIKIYRGEYCKSFEKLMQTIDIESVEKNEYFFYSIDVNTFICAQNILIDNGAIDYSIFLNHSLKDLMGEDKERNKVIGSIEKYINRLNIDCENEDINRNIEHIKEMINGKATDLESALQRILFINQLIWQTGHRLNGLGRLDVVLERYITDDIPDEDILALLKQFCITLHKHYYFKSNQLNGDTGQLIILGGYTKDEALVHNRITDLFLEAVAEVALPDPKILLRVSKETDDYLWKNAMDCLKSKTGSPLFSNDDIVIDRLVEFGYERTDAINYTTSACWEPIPYDCIEQNNLEVINFLEPFIYLSKHILQFLCIEEVYRRYYDLLDRQIKKICRYLSKIKYNYDPLISMGINYCQISGIDISQGGGKYKNIGVLSVGLANAVNSILIIEEAFENNTLIELQKRISENNKGIARKFETFFGQDDERVLKLTNSIIDHCGKEFEKYTNYYGGGFKFGLSAPDYITAARKIGATPDGRKQGEPMSVHISSDYGESPTELLGFASKLNYTRNAINGNVVDFFLSGALVVEHTNKCIQLLKGAIIKGIYQMQMNLVDSKTLIEARNNPEAFPNLIVRVWGFSAYFNELPDEYKEYLIERAKACEHAC